MVICKDEKSVTAGERWTTAREERVCGFVLSSIWATCLEYAACINSCWGQSIHTFCPIRARTRAQRILKLKCNLEHAQSSLKSLELLMIISDFKIVWFDAAACRAVYTAIHTIQSTNKPKLHVHPNKTEVQQKHAHDYGSIRYQYIHLNLLEIRSAFV